MSYQKPNDDHASFLQKKKEEILARKKLQEKVSSSKVSTKPSDSSSFTSNKDGPKLPFANDGSFLERFKAMQEQQKKSTSSVSSPSLKNSVVGPSVKSQSIPSTTKAPSMKISELKVPASIFERSEEVNESTIESGYEVAKQLAERVSSEGLQIEASARIQFKHDSRYRFLFDPSSPVAAFYQSEKKSVNHHAGVKRQWGPPWHTTSSLEQQRTATAGPSSSSSTSSPPDISSEFEKAKALVRAKAMALMSGVTAQQPSANVISEEEKKRQKDIEEQRMMQDIYRKVIDQQVALAKQESVKRKKRKADKPKYEYDSDEDIEGGTWEHKKRTNEMTKTQDWAMDLTTNAQGKHHLADFLPPDELEKFMEKIKAVKEGREADFSDYAKYRIQDDNIGFKMLQKAGWKEGEGLGPQREGILQPVNKGKISFDQAGVGAEKPAEVKKDDNEFELYRKRMMLSYKFRPNPLNNPRRPYY